jgi:hypothetical protein
MKQQYTQEQYALCLHGVEANDSFETIAKATGMRLLTVATYAQPKLREWLRNKATGVSIDRGRKRSKITSQASGVFNNSVLNDIFIRLTPSQKQKFEQAMIEVILKQAFI